MPSRRSVVTAALGLGAAVGLAHLFRANHSLPPTDLAAEARFRELQARALRRYAVAADSRQITIDDPALDVHVLDVGEGAPILFLHGGNSVAAGWIPLLGKLDGYRKLAPDRPGCGLTTKLDYSGIDLREHATAFVGAVMTALGLERASIVGNSMGGYFALVFALSQPERVDKLVLIGEPAGSAPTIRVANRLVGTRIVNSALFLTVLEPGPETMRNSLRNMLVAHPERVSSELFECLTAGAVLPGAAESWITMNETLFRPRGAGLFSGSSTLSYALRPELGRLRAPTLLLWGERDTFGPPSLGEEMAKLMVDGRCVVVPDAGHLPWLDNVDLCAEHIRLFLA
jgi:pimeloyl-ACP methyl ester carboxylesterase